jgi:membrane associated rhomboid family serine protease
MYDPNSSYIPRERTGSGIKSLASTSPSIVIIILCTISFFIELIQVNDIGNRYVDVFHFDPDSFITAPWTLVTYIFLHASLLHLFFNMLVLFFFGTVLERRAGNRQLLTIFFVSGILSALGYALLSQPVFNIFPGPMVGASGAIYGVFSALAVLEPDLRVYVYFFPMKLKYALVLFALFDFFMINSSDMVAHTAHLSGLFIGLYMGYRIKKDQEKQIKYRYSGRW